MDQWQKLEAHAADLGKGDLLFKPDGVLLDVEHGYIPLLINLTFEDKAAKGLRKRKAGGKREVAVYLTAVEGVRDNRTLLLTGASGAGKTTLAKHLCFRLATGHAHLERLVIRNEDGEERDETWDGPKIVPHIVTIDNPETLHRFVQELPRSLQAWSEREQARRNQELLFILDSIENSGQEGANLLSSVVDLIRTSEDSRLLVLGRQEALQNWTLPVGLSRQQLLPFLQSQRRQSVSRWENSDPSVFPRLGSGVAASLPSIFAMSLSCNSQGDTSEDTLDAWMEQHLGSGSQREHILTNAYNAFYDRDLVAVPDGVQEWPFVSSTSIQQLLLAKILAPKPEETILRILEHKTSAAFPIIRSILRRLTEPTLQKSLITNMLQSTTKLTAQRVALLAADFLDVDDSEFTLLIKSYAWEVIEQGSLSVPERAIAGRILSRLGDPRSLDALTVVPAGKSTHGSISHPNSAPTHELELDEFQIGVFPVVNLDYLKYIQETGREWVSPDGTDPEMQNAPATDLTWHDAQAYCTWLTGRWRQTGKIGSKDIVKLPTEPQWERACRGYQIEGYPGEIIYPWGSRWAADVSNCEELALNNKCAVGIFPSGRSPYGCYDMTGQVWEWCTTLWGSDMATPSFQYPWTDKDGREEVTAEESIRRVLRGGCFSSGELKANCTYRGSLEPAGFWRGNGFRIVVVPSTSEQL